MDNCPTHEQIEQALKYIIEHSAEEESEMHLQALKNIEDFIKERKSNIICSLPKEAMMNIENFVTS